MALLLGAAWSVSALASDGMTRATADMDAPAAASHSDSSVLPALADGATKSSSDVVDEQAGADESANTVNEPAESALQLPGVSEAALPRFRRQMYRTDI